MAAAVVNIPDPSVPLTDQNGRITHQWFQALKALKLSRMTDVSTTSPTNGQVLVWNSSTGLWTPGAN